MVNSAIPQEVLDRKVKLSPEERAVIRRGKLKRAVFIICMIIVPLVNFFVFYVYVNFNAILQGFIDVDGSFTLDWFKKFFLEWAYMEQYGKSPMWVYTGNTMMYFLSSIVIMMPLTTIIAYFIYKKIFMYKFFRVMFFMPSILSSVVLGMLYKWLWSTPVANHPGPLLQLFQNVFNVPMTTQNLIESKTLGRWIILLYCVWTGFGTNLILMTGAMARIPEDVLEAGQLDGVSSAKEVTSIIIPLIWPTLTTLIVMAFTGLFTASGPLLVLDKNNAGDTMTLSYYIFVGTEKGGSNLNYLSAVGIFFTIVGMPIILGVKKLMERYQDAIEY